MFESRDFTAVETVQETEHALLYRGTRKQDARQVLLKVVRTPAQPASVERLRNEYRVGRSLADLAVIKPLELVDHEGMPAIVFDGFRGQPLDGLLGAPMRPERFLELAIGATSALDALHKSGVIHRDIKPRSVLVDPDTGAVRLTELGIATDSPREQPPGRGPALIMGTLPYMAPEQTGRIGRVVDERSDLYGLGVTFYRMLTGRLPFSARDPLEWVHCHLARAPPPPTEIVPEIPGVLSQLVLRLLAKAPEDRYQSAASLESDLRTCLDAWRANGRIVPFELGRRDRLEFRVPQKLYGREVEVGQLQAAFANVLTGSSVSVVLVSGGAGIGKSALANEVQRLAVRERALFLSGKGDQYRPNVPFALLAQAFTPAVLDLLAQDEQEIARWRSALETALGKSGRLIAELVPALELLLGAQPPLVDVPPAEAQRRFVTAMRRFVSVFATAEHPLVLFLDDLQWVDAASLSLLQELCNHPDSRYLMVIGAYRGGLPVGHPVLELVAKLKRGSSSLTQITPRPLALAHVERLVADALRGDPEHTRPLAKLLWDYSGGVPFALGQLLTTLRREGLVHYDDAREAWSFDIDKIRSIGWSGSDVGLVRSRLQRLPGAAQDLLSRAACLGNSWQLEALAAVSDRTEEDTAGLLLQPLRDGLVVRGEESYSFAHDRVQQAAYSLLPESHKPALHLRIAETLLAQARPARLEEAIFDIVLHMNRASALLDTPEERLELAQLNLLAAKKAKAAIAYQAAVQYCAAGMESLPGDSWERAHALAFALHLERAVCEFVLGNHAASDRLLAIVIANAASRTEQAAAYCLKIDLQVTQGRMSEAVATGLDCLGRWGLDLKAQPPVEQVRRECELLLDSFRDRSIEGLTELPRMTDPDICAPMQVLVHIMTPAAYTDGTLTWMIAHRMVVMSLEHGNSDGSAAGYVGFALVVASLFGRYREAYRFGRVGYDLVQQPGLSSLKPFICLVFGNIVNFWTHHVKSDLPYLDEALAAALEVGDLTYACYALNHRAQAMLAMGGYLPEIHAENSRALEFHREARFDDMYDLVQSRQLLLQNLRGETNHFSTLSTADLEEEAFEERLRTRMAPTQCWHWLHALEARFFSGDYEAALAAAEKARAIMWSSPCFWVVPECAYYYALSLAASYDAAPPGERERRLAALTGEEARFVDWQASCPENFRHKHSLIAAEIARITGRDADAGRLYELAYRAALEQGFIQDQAIACELAARFYQSRGIELAAQAYMTKAYSCYTCWGATAKVAQLERRFPALAAQRHREETAIAVHPEHLDLLSVVKASHAISSEMRVDKLAWTLLGVALEESGAARGALILPTDGELIVEAEASLTESGDTQRTSEPRPISSELVPPSIVSYSMRTRQPVIVGEAGAPGRFADDPYFVGHQPRSILCLPILRHGEVVGLLYLENDLLSGVFTADRLAALELLAAQAAISLANAGFLVREHEARHSAEQAAGRAAFLAEATTLLSESLDLEQTLAALARLVVRSMADWCVIDLVGARGEIQRVAWSHRDASRELRLAELGRRYPPGPDSPHPASRVLRTREALLISELGDELILEQCVDAEHARLIREIGSESFIAVPLIARAELIGVITLVSSSRERRYGPQDLELAQELARRAAFAIDNAQLYRGAREAVHLRDEFLIVAAHELNTPMTSLLLALQSLARASGKSALDVDGLLKTASVAERQGQRMKRLVGELLDVTRLDLAPMLLERREIDLSALAREVLTRFERDFERAGCVLALRAPEPVVGTWDGLRLDQVISNLLSNALKFGAGRPVEVSVENTPSAAELAVCDHGIGVPLDRQQSIFDRFERAVSAMHYGGLGLGLYLCRRIAEAHGGSIRVDSRPEQGATFTVTLPR